MNKQAHCKMPSTFQFFIFAVAGSASARFRRAWLQAGMHFVLGILLTEYITTGGARQAAAASTGVATCIPEAQLQALNSTFFDPRLLRAHLDSYIWAQILLSTGALEKSAVACLSLPRSDVLEPFTELLEHFLADGGSPAPDVACAIVQLGQTIACESSAVRSAAQQCVKAVVQHMQSQGQPQHISPASDANDSEAAALSKLESNIAELEASATQPSSSIR